MAARTKADAKPPTDAEKLETVAEAVDSPAAPNGFFITTTDSEDGNISIDVVVVGDRRLTEAPVFLKKAITLVEERLGVA